MILGVFDSGVGGLSVLKSLLHAKLFKEYIYYGDTARVPYGVKDKDTIIKFSLEALEFFKEKKVDMLIIACNTVSAYALEILRANAPFPVLGVIDAGVLAVKNSLKDKNSNILVIATQATVNSHAYKQALLQEGFLKVEEKATGLFVPMVEEGIFQGEFLEAAFEYYFNKLKFHPNALILACTHFPLIAHSLAEYFGKNTKLIHSGEAIALQLQKEFNLTSIQEEANIDFYASSDVEKLKKIANLWL
ncbi:glutamate racemase [Campylobacter subantarcticus LMG 24377]|uniref:Glutamate racemase n=2 Tax=Campylobacter subantarcticus TaxID=497724 RepID=A0A0A8H7G5_9BACT|nr:glutamate racemase [Campylobacter subantarcticus]EAJ1260824.1 glutamate racemase [Campylobacter lari]AJC89991.1 glutamate racemase [Campylobacter subantarcticus LMG 24374]AJC91658.1 glutamate racemase [Campylobacter subantarcticus LMG 24377]EAL3939060.1 glutamate racemase [Campylobacter lari]MPB98896.1 glutamate racemase [Campylobacter subantarcticus]